MRCREVMKSEVQFCRPNDPIYRVAEQMANQSIGFLPVIDSMKRLVGVVTDRDLAIRATAHRLDYQTPVEQVMTTELVTCRPLDPIEKAERSMAQNRKSRLPLVDDFGECVGVISLSDLALAIDAAEAGQLLESVAEREAKLTLQ